MVVSSVRAECELHTPPCRYMSKKPTLWDHITRLWVKSADEVTRALAKHTLRPMWWQGISIRAVLLLCLAPGNLQPSQLIGMTKWASGYFSNKWSQLFIRTLETSQDVQAAGGTTRKKQCLYDLVSGRPGSSVGRACDRRAEALPSLQRQKTSKINIYICSSFTKICEQTDVLRQHLSDMKSRPLGHHLKMKNAIIGRN